MFFALKKKNLSKTVVHAINIRLLSKLRKSQGNRTSIFFYHVQHSENNGFEKNHASLDYTTIQKKKNILIWGPDIYIPMYFDALNLNPPS